jgi:hypothetical protein
MWWCQRSLLVVTLAAILSSCASTAGTRRPASREEAVYAALAQQLLLLGPNTREGIFEARSSLPGLDSLRLELQLTRVAHERPSLDPIILAFLRQTARDTNCLPLPSDWHPYGLRLRTECAPAWSADARAKRAWQSRVSTLGSSHIAFSTDSTTAVVLGEISCGRDCAHTAYYVFDRTASGWRVAHVVLIFES